MYGSNFCIVTLRPRSTSSLPREAAAMPFPREDTTPPVTKMYLVAFGVVIRPALGRCASGLPPAGDRRLCLLRVAQADREALHRWSFRCAVLAAVPAALPFRPDSAGVLSTASGRHA